MNTRRQRSKLRYILLTVLVGLAAAPAQDNMDDPQLGQAEHALRNGRLRDAVELATRVIEKQPDSSPAYLVRGRARLALGQLKEAVVDLSKSAELEPTAAAYFHRGECYARLEEHRQAVEDLTRAIELDSNLSSAYHYRGRERFKLGEIEQSIADFDRAIELDPRRENWSWERGLSRYYAGQFAKAQKSFEDYHRVGPEDIENGLWRMLSQAEVEGLPAARKALFAYSPKRRPPFPLLYDLYAGTSDPDHVLTRASDGAANDEDRKTRTFYAHAYIGFWFVMNRNRTAAIEHLEKAVALRSDDYMWHVANLHLKLLKRSVQEPE